MLCPTSNILHLRSTYGGAHQRYVIGFVRGEESPARLHPCLAIPLRRHIHPRLRLRPRLRRHAHPAIGLALIGVGGGQVGGGQGVEAAGDGRGVVRRRDQDRIMGQAGLGRDLGVIDLEVVDGDVRQAKTAQSVRGAGLQNVAEDGRLDRRVLQRAIGEQQDLSGH